MSLSDPLGDMLTRIRNGQHARMSVVVSPASKLRVNVLEVLKREGFIRGWSEEELRPGVKNLKIELKYHEGEPVIKQIARVSKPGRRVYSKIADLPRVYNGLGLSILSTPRGVMSDNEARAANVGGGLADVAHWQASRAGPGWRRRKGRRSAGDGQGQAGATQPDPDRRHHRLAGRRQGGGEAGKRQQARPRHVGDLAHPDQQHGHRCQPGLHDQPGNQRRRLPRGRAGQGAGTPARLLARREVPDPGRHHDQVRQADGHFGQRLRQAQGRPGRRRDPWLEEAGALQGQGHQVRDRNRPAQGR
ncbi:hypothetical protein Lal_00005093 [Lupinus albus]|nr:hypothetical protein Lal_00005093 [Lupinus albus]